MSKFYDKYKELKQNSPNTLFLFKAGIFLLFIAEDAKIASSLLSLKLGNLNSEVVKCRFSSFLFR